MKNSWIAEVIEKAEETRKHGQIILNIHDGDIPSVEIRERINKPTPKKQFEVKQGSLK